MFTSQSAILHYTCRLSRISWNLIGLTNGTTVSPISGTMTVIGQGYLSDIAGAILGGIAVIGFVLCEIINVEVASSFSWKYSALSKRFYFVLMLGSSGAEWCIRSNLFT